MGYVAGEISDTLTFHQGGPQLKSVWQGRCMTYFQTAREAPHGSVLIRFALEEGIHQCPSLCIKRVMKCPRPLDNESYDKERIETWLLIDQ